jgi:hypothetical protein
MEWFYADASGGQHPVPADDLPRLVGSGAIGRDTLVWNETMTGWTDAAAALPHLFEVLPPQLTLAQRRGVLAAPDGSLPQAKAPTDAVAVCALVFGVLGLPICLPIFSIPAIVCGHIARRRAREESAPTANGGLALAGLIMGYLGLAALVAMILFYVGMIGFAVATEGIDGNGTTP